MRTTSFFQKMHDGTEINVMRWIPDIEIKGLVQLSHGMMEHAARYDKLGSIFTDAGYLFSAHDHRGHGKTAIKAKEENSGDFGYLADVDGFNKVEGDLEEVISKLKDEYKDKKTFLIGHSFGSFVTQNLMEKNGKLVDAVVLCGTAGPRWYMDFAKLLFDLNGILFGEKHRSRFCTKCAFSSYNKRIKPLRTPDDWLSRNEMNVDMFRLDEWCGITPTSLFFSDLVSGLIQIHDADNIRNIPKDLPVYMVYGAEDPVGSYGKTIKKLMRIYQQNGMSDVSIKEWPLDRHEIFNEIDGDEVIDDVIQWIGRHL